MKISGLNKFAKRLCGCLCLAAICTLCGCDEIEEKLPETVSVTEAAEERPYPVTVGSLIFNSQPESAGSLSPAITEILCELGHEGTLIGRSSYCDYPSGIDFKTDLGSAANPDVAAIIDTKPQLLLSHSPIAKKDITAIENAGTRVWIIPAPDSVEELYVCYRDIAAVFGGKTGCEEAASEAMKPLVTALHDARNSMESFVYIMSPQLAAASDSTFAGSFFSSFGKNAAGDADTLTEEELLDLDPEWVILPYNVSAEALPEDLTAVQSGKVIILDEETLERIERPTARLDGVVRSLLEQIKAEP